ncbi:oligosaccharyl transferase subunit ost3/OST6 [Conoideocrella luteorostrata]|uniref:Oligosaccharyl transferase subunit ost3/OST6 n=1 Tax=Conoideocrella luteorostrata TaxID=1105319 RepID=A0AAJ0CVR3_9HYPO|nr:oligosaccharyl transferase subunit ost3/OST6 [Conoideocrella luteorostrata]
MRFLSTLASGCALVASAFAAEETSQQRFAQFTRISRLTTPIQLNDASYKSLTASPRDYAVAIVLTAQESRFGCQLCRDFKPEWELVSQSWTKGDRRQESRLLFGVLDFTEGRDTFLSLGLQTAPVLMLFPPTTGPHAVASVEPIRYDFNTGSPSAEQVHAWLTRNLPDRPHPELKRPINWLKWASVLTFLAGAVTVTVSAAPYVLPIIQSRNLWAAGSMIAILLFTSGHMFNHIRKVPYVAGDGKGGITYFAGGFQSQLGLETQIIAAMYGLLSFCTIALATKVPRMTNSKSQSVVVLVWGAIMFFMFSFLLSVFRIKNASYPFSLPPFM